VVRAHRGVAQQATALRNSDELALVPPRPPPARTLLQHSSTRTLHPGQPRLPFDSSQLEFPPRQLLREMTTTIRAFASSRLINPAGATPVLTVEQVWAGLSIKAKKPQSFVAAISSCEVVSEVGNKVSSTAAPGCLGQRQLILVTVDREDGEVWRWTCRYGAD
jgi:hypothetical protein